MNKISDVLIAPQPVVDEQKTNDLRQGCQIVLGWPQPCII